MRFSLPPKVDETVPKSHVKHNTITEPTDKALSSSPKTRESFTFEDCTSTSYDTPGNMQNHPTSALSRNRNTVEATSSLKDHNHSQKDTIFRVHITGNVKCSRYLIDTGAEVSVVPPSAKERLNPSPTRKLFVANGTQITTYGSKRLTVDMGLQQPFSWSFLIADVSSQS